MNITQKEVITKIHAEISQDEFIESYMEMMDAVIRHDWHDVRINYDTCKETIDKYKSLTLGLRKDMAFKSFNDIFDMVRNGTIRFIGYKHGYDVDHYGYVDGNTKALNVVYFVRGNHL